MPGIAVAFHNRSVPLEPRCVVGTGAVSRALGARVLRYPDARLESLRGVVADGTLLLLGASDCLPWVDGATYLGCDPEAPFLLLSTRHRPNVPVDAFERALLRHAQSIPPPIAVLLHPSRLVSVADARILERARLQHWVEGA